MHKLRILGEGLFDREVRLPGDVLQVTIVLLYTIRRLASSRVGTASDEQFARG